MVRVKSVSLKIKRYLEEVGQGEEILAEMLGVLIRAIEERDEYTRGHSERVMQLSETIGKRLGLSSEKLKLLGRGALLHDIGKIGIRDELLYKPGNFTPEERARMNQHPEKGHFIVLNCHLLWNIIPMIRNHHENYDGSGYPDGLKGEAIPLEARIVSVADYFDALATARPYKAAFSKEESISSIRSLSSKKFDPRVVQAFLEVIDDFYAQRIASP